MIDFFRERLNTALLAGILPEQVIIDPGIGFRQTRSDNLKTAQVSA